MRVDKLYEIFKWNACKDEAGIAYCKPGGPYLQKNGKARDHPRKTQRPAITQFTWDN